MSLRDCLAFLSMIALVSRYYMYLSNSLPIQIYVPRDSVDFMEIATSGGGSATLLVAKKDDPADYDEIAVPFQFVHKLEVKY